MGEEKKKDRDALLKTRQKIKRKKPRFRRQEIHRKKALEDVWRKPRGIHSKKRQQIKSKGAIPKPGYGSPALVRGLNGAGFREIMVSNVGDLEKVGSGDVAVISHSVGGKKRLAITEAAIKKNIKVSNAKY